MKNLELLLVSIKNRIYERSEHLLFDILIGSILFFSVCGAGYFWLDGMVAEYAKTKNMNIIFPFLMRIITGCFMAVSLLNIFRTILAHIKMKWFKYASLRFTVFDTFDFLDTIKLSKQENRQLFEIPLTKECLLYLTERIEKNGHLEHDDVQYVYHKMKNNIIAEDNTFLIEKVKDFFDKNDIDVNTISTISANGDKTVQHTQVINGKKDLKKML